MAIKNSNIKPDSALSVVSMINADVYLGGSRYMAEKFGFTVPKDADYDFYVDASDEVADALLAGGFESMAVDPSMENTECDEYNDNGVVAAFQRDNVQVLLRNDAHKYSMIFDCLTEEAYKKLVWKSSPTSIFAEYGIGEEDRKLILKLMFDTMTEVADTFIADSNKIDDNAAGVPMSQYWNIPSPILRTPKVQK